MKDGLRIAFRKEELGRSLQTLKKIGYDHDDLKNNKLVFYDKERETHF